MKSTIRTEQFISPFSGSPIQFKNGSQKRRPFQIDRNKDLLAVTHMFNNTCTMVALRRDAEQQFICNSWRFFRTLTELTEAS